MAHKRYNCIPLFLQPISSRSLPPTYSLVFHFFFRFAAAGLYYLAELVEEFTVIAKKVISYFILSTTLIYTLFIFFDGLPWSMVLCGLLAQCMHAFIMTGFPYVRFLSIPFIGAFTMLLVNHWLAFEYFAANYYAFSEVLPCRLESRIRVCCILGIRHSFHSNTCRCWLISHFACGSCRSLSSYR